MRTVDHLTLFEGGAGTEKPVSSLESPRNRTQSDSLTRTDAELCDDQNQTRADAVPVLDPLGVAQETEAPASASPATAGLPVPSSVRFWIDGGKWYGEGVEAFPIGLCACCGWEAPLQSTGENAACLLCHPANKKQRGSGTPLQCETFCEEGESLLQDPARLDPGGLVCCSKCRAKVAAIREWRRQQKQAGQQDVAATA